MAAPARTRRILTAPNIGAVIVGVIVFLTTIRLWDTFVGAFAAAAAAALVTGLVWYLWWRLTTPAATGSTLEAPSFGDIPAITGTPTPTLTAADSPAAVAFGEVAARIETETPGQILLVSSPAPVKAQRRLR